ncbi:MAG: efflux RND transporter permease subunit [Phycisphaerae bacterium]
MIARLIHWCVRNRAMVLMLTAVLLAGGVWSARNITVDAIPDLSDVQVVLRTEYPGQAPRIVEDQVTYPLTTAMLAVPGAEVVRGYSMFGTSFVYVIFEDGTDLYWARSRVLEQLSTVAGRLPDGVTPRLGPDATAVGWIYQYVLTTGSYCPEHPQGIWHDPQADRWYADANDATADVRDRLVLKRVFDDRETCPLDGSRLAKSEYDLADLRGLQDWYLRYELSAVEGVAEVAPVGGFVKQYQVVADPVKLRAHDIDLQRVKTAIRRSNEDVGGRLIEQSETEYMVRGLGYLGTAPPAPPGEAPPPQHHRATERRVLEHLRGIALGATADGVPIRLGDVADVRTGPDIRRGIAEWNGEGEVVGGVVIMRFGENARDTIERARAKLDELKQNLPPGVDVRVAYDRSDLIDRAVATVYNTLTEQILVVSLVIVLFLLHARSALVAAFILPTGVLSAIAIMYLLDINANIMSLGGVAISIGVMVDSSIVMVENAHKHLQRNRLSGADKPRALVIAAAAAEVGPTLFFSLLIITVSFLPIFVLGQQSGRLFRPLAYTKTFAMAAAAVLAVTVIPVLMVFLIRGRVLPSRWPRRHRLTVYIAAVVLPALAVAFAPMYRLEPYRWYVLVGWVVLAGVVLLPQKIFPEEKNPASIVIEWTYRPLFNVVMRHRIATLIIAAGVMAATIWPFSRLGSEFMPPLEEGDLLYMPTTDPGIGPTRARELLQQTDKLISQFPEVKAVFGKIGRAQTATDPAPMSMIETTITLHRDKDQWRTRPVERFHSDWPGWLSWLPGKIWPDQRPITVDELVYGYELTGPDGGMIHVPGLNDACRIPGLTNSWTMPIRTRIDMLSTGIRTPVGVKLMGPDLGRLAELSEQVAAVLRTDRRTSPYTTSAFAEKSTGGNYFDIHIRRDKIERYALNVADVQDVISSSLGGMNVTHTVEGLERYPVNLRYPRELRDNVEKLRQVLVATPSGAQVPLAQLADISIHKGPPVVKSENARPTSWVFVDIADIDVGTYVSRARQVVAENVRLPSGYSIVWSGQYEYMQEARQRLGIVVPLTAVLILLLLYGATRSWTRVGILVLALPFSLVGSFWLLYLLDYNLSLAVWVGVIALAGLEVETALVLLMYLEGSFRQYDAEGRMRTPTDLVNAVRDGAVRRTRPITMTELTTFLGLVPLLWAVGAGAMRRLAVPMVGGVVTGYIGMLTLYPVLFYFARRVTLARRSRGEAAAATDES